MLNVLTSVAKKCFSKYRIKERQKFWRKSFSANIKKSILSNEQKRQVKDYYAPYNKKIVSLYHEFYTQKTGEFHVNYLPDELYYCYIDPYYNDWSSAKYLDNKCYYPLLLADVKQPTTIGMRINGIWYKTSSSDLKPIDTIDSLFDDSIDDLFVKKATDSEGGHGVVFIEKNDNLREKIKKAQSLSGDIIVQKALVQSAMMSKLNPSSVNTIRVLSLLGLDGKATIYSIVVRMGINGSKVDNASSGGITCGVYEDGRMKETAFAANGDRYNTHPNTKIRFNEIIIPNFQRIKEIVCSVHPRFSHYRLLSWDFAIDENDDVNLIEVNLHYGELDFHQLNNGPLFGEDTERILNEVFGVK